jgi:hypothetical protein
MKVEPLVGNYCSLCTRSLVDFQLAKYSIVIMCQPDQEQLLHNGDMERLSKLIDQKETSNAT